MRFIKYFRQLCWVFLLLFSTFAINAATSVVNKYATASLFSDTRTAQPGQMVWVVLSLKMQPKWHSYWKNPGETGLPPKIKWTLPQGLTAGEIHYLSPTRFDTQGIISFGYTNTAHYLIPISISKATQLQNSVLKAHVDYLVCKEECIPEQASLTLPLTIGKKHIASAQEKTVQALIKQIPPQLDVPSHFSTNETNLNLRVPAPEVKQNIKGAYFFPVHESVVDINQPQQIHYKNDHLHIKLQRDFQAPPKELKGILHIITPTGTKSFQLSAKQHTATSETFSRWQFWRAILFAILGGIILNAMPCVFPILSLKALSIVKQASACKTTVRLNGLAYTLGIIISFIILGGLLVLLKLGGMQLGWGFQMQSPVFIATMFLLLFVIALNLLGVFEFTSRFSGAGQGLIENTKHYWSSFFTGVLATIVATPCTAPFMGVAMGYAFTQPVFVIFIFFIMLGFGLALPFLLLSVFPGLMRFLPKPGAWMETFKELMAFPLLLTCIWLVWVLTQQIGGTGLVLILFSAFLMSFAFWLWRKFNKLLTKIITLIITLLVLAFCFYQLGQLEPVVSTTTKTELQQPFSLQALQKLRQEGKPVFVNVTADWCITCKVNERGALASIDVKQALQKKGIHYLVADWTHRDSAISKYLASFDRQGVPLYVFYPANQAPIVLPQLLTSQRLIKVFNTR